MFCRVSDLKGRTVRARDGDVGSVEDVYFDDEHLAVRYLVVKTGTWLRQRRVLVSPRAVHAWPTEGVVEVDVTREQVEHSPPIESDEPVSRRYEKAYADYYRQPYYWNGPNLWGIGAYPAPWPGEAFEYGGRWNAAERSAAEDEALQAEVREAEECHLRSANEVMGYHVVARDGEVGEIDDLLVDPKDWSVRELVVDTRLWWPGGHVSVPADALESIDWSSSRAGIKLDRATVRGRGT